MPRRYLLALAVIAILFFVGIFLLISFISHRGGGGDKAEPTTTTVEAKKFSDNTDRVSYTVYGPVVGEEDRRAVRITVSATERRAEVLQGYYETVIKHQTTANNQAAFDNLLIALQGAGFDQYNSRVKTDERSVCTTGERYVIEASNQGNQTVHAWATNCSSKEGNFLGELSLVEELMQSQIPKYDDFVADVNL